MMMMVETIILQKKFVLDILDKALLSDQQKELYKLLQKLLNHVFTFTLTKEKYVYPAQEVLFCNACLRYIIQT